MLEKIPSLMGQMMCGNPHYLTIISRDCLPIKDHIPKIPFYHHFQQTTHLMEIVDPALALCKAAALGDLDMMDRLLKHACSDIPVEDTAAVQAKESSLLDTGDYDKR